MQNVFNKRKNDLNSILNGLVAKKMKWFNLAQWQLRGFQSGRNSIDWATANGRRILVPTSVDRGVSRVQCGGTLTAINLSFLDRSPCSFFQVAPQLCSRGWVDPVPDPQVLRKSVRGIELGTSGFAARRSAQWHTVTNIRSCTKCPRFRDMWRLE
jgi:hypothetical protein